MLAEHSRHRTSPAASGIQSHALSHDAPASMRTRSPLGITSVRGFECTAHSPTVGLNCESTCCPETLTIGGVTSAAPVPTVRPRPISAFVRFRDVGCPRRCNRPPMRASDRAGWTSTRRRDHLRDLGRALGSPGETGVSGDCGTVYGVDGLKVGGGCGGGGSGNCACACSIARLKKANHPATKILASAIRSNLVVCIAVSFEPMYRHGPLD